MRQDSTVRLPYEEEEKEIAVVRSDRRPSGRNPYLVDYARQRGSRPADPDSFESRRRTAPAGRQERAAAGRRTGDLSLDWYPTAREPMQRTGRRGESYVQSGAQVSSRGQIRQMSSAQETGNRPTHAAQHRRPGNRSAQARRISGGTGSDVRRIPQSADQIHNRRQAGTPNRRSEAAYSAAQAPARRKNSVARAALSRRRQRVLMQRIAVGLWALCIVVLAVIFVVRNDQVSAAPSPKEDSMSEMDNQKEQTPAGAFVQGLPADVYAKHPDWTENFLTPNEYSRPGNPLESVTNIFVHYTANPGTSAAQNRSYFEQQKDTHEASVSAHFIIGYEGEIIQCVPLDEIAYAVMTRNYDSISIECCYKASDGSFTQETYDSLISLLAWLIDAYDLDSNDILRHYDCGGKKCPIYYTEHPGAWEQLKKDVDNLQ